MSLKTKVCQPFKVEASKTLAPTKKSPSDLSFLLATVGAFAKICARFRLFIIKDQFFIRIYFSFGTPGLKVASNDGMFLYYIISAHYYVKRIRLRQKYLKSCLFDLNLPLPSLFVTSPVFHAWGGGTKRNVCIGRFLQL